MTRNSRLTSRGIYTIRALCREDWPITSLTETGQRIGVTRERIRQLVRQYGIPTLLIGERGQGDCSWCGGKSNTKRFFCQRCYWWSTRSVFQCDECGAYFPRNTKQANGSFPSRRKDKRYKGKHYCSQPCFSSAHFASHWWEKSPIWQKNQLKRLAVSNEPSPGCQHEWVNVMYVKCSKCGTIKDEDGLD